WALRHQLPSRRERLTERPLTILSGGGPLSDRHANHERRQRRQLPFHPVRHVAGQLQQCPELVRRDGRLIERRRDPIQPFVLVVGIVLFIGSEAMFFSGLFGTYYTLRAQTAVWTPKDIKVDAIRLLATVILLSSSLTMQMASHRIKQGDTASMRRWIWFTFLM